jgi:hypothetical protein
MIAIPTRRSEINVPAKIAHRRYRIWDSKERVNPVKAVRRCVQVTSKARIERTQ